MPIVLHYENVSFFASHVVAKSMLLLTVISQQMTTKELVLGRNLGHHHPKE
jgi:hypothetical protein